MSGFCRIFQKKGPLQGCEVYFRTMKKGVIVSVNTGSVIMADPMQPKKCNLFMFGEISSWWGVNKETVIPVLKANRFTEIDLFISSPGGEVTEAFIIHDLLRGSAATVTAYLMGECSSAATVIASSADRVVMSKQCTYMIHKPLWSAVYGANADDLEKLKQTLDVYEEGILNVYRRKTGMSDDELKALMSEATFMHADMALSLGFVDEVAETITIDWSGQSFGELGYPRWMDYYYDDYDAYDSARNYGGVDVNAIYKQSVLNFIERGLSDKIVSVADNKTTLSMNQFLSRVMNTLKGYIPGDKQEEALNALKDMDIMAALSEQVDSTVQSAIEKRASSVQAVAPQAADNSELISRIDKLVDDMETLRTSLHDVAQRVPAAASGAGIKPSAGASPVPPAKDDAPKASNDAQEKILRDGVRNGQITRQTYETVTGRKYEA